MSISFTTSIISRLKREIAALEAQSVLEKNKSIKAQAKLKQLQKDSKKSSLPSDLSSKLTRINKLNEEIAESAKKQAELSRQLVYKKSELKKHSS
ncbi:hypothetical protein SAMN04487969_1266 [Paenibacillus algorifonticola]|uniref:Uncharacterized protein n=1 Tax=Paenibacillus algorifonticola TaxID=684063 RepID=A0A1I2HSS1_9BACL|nr:hypothetical protein SAMN04487969_1266 [Paenibacillus algorifonticola]